MAFQRCAIWAMSVRPCNTMTDGLDNFLRLHVYQQPLTSNRRPNDPTNTNDINIF